MMLALEYHLDETKEIVVVGSASGAGVDELLAPLRVAFVPNRVLTVVTEGQNLAAMLPLVPLISGKVASRGRATAYVCANRVCSFPTSDPAKFDEQIRRVKLID
jgi:uncharacterized protein YyaL (SSP411 family)